MKTTKLTVLIAFFLFLIPFVVGETYEFSGNVFNNGVYNQTNLNNSVVLLNQSYSYGEYYSEILDAGSDADWNTFFYEPGYWSFRYPENGEIDTTRGIDMTGNVLLYNFDETSGQIFDTSGFSSTGNYTGVDYDNSGVINKSLSFNGSTDYINVPNNKFNFGKDTDYTIVTWVKRDTFGTNQLIFDTRNSSTQGIGLWLDTNNYVVARTGVFTATSSPITVADSEWHLIAAIVDRDTDIKLYIDGLVDTTATVTNTQNVTTDTTAATIGRVSYGAVLFYDGLLDELAIFNRTLTKTELDNLYNLSVGQINVTVRTCDDIDCIADPWSDTYSHMFAPTTLSLAHERFFQFRAKFNTLNTNNSPYLLNATVDYTPDPVYNVTDCAITPIATNAAKIGGYAIIQANVKDATTNHNILGAMCDLTVYKDGLPFYHYVNKEIGNKLEESNAFGIVSYTTIVDEDIWEVGQNLSLYYSCYCDNETACIDTVTGSYFSNLKVCSKIETGVTVGEEDIRTFSLNTSIATIGVAIIFSLILIIIAYLSRNTINDYMRGLFSLVLVGLLFAAVDMARVFVVSSSGSELLVKSVVIMEIGIGFMMLGVLFFTFYEFLKVVLIKMGKFTRRGKKKKMKPYKYKKIPVDDYTHRVIKESAARKGVSMGNYLKMGAKKKQKKGVMNEIEDLFW